jgi:D-alanine-D-alanine ligase
MFPMSLHIGLAYDLRSEYIAAGWSEEDAAEFDSEETINGLEEAIRGLGHDVERIGNARVLCRRLVAGDRWDLVFNVTEGCGGRSREAQVPAMLELYGVPYTFSDPLTCAVTMDKPMAKRLVREAGLSTAPFVVVSDLSDLKDLKLSFPLFAKPAAEGTGKGISQNSRIDSVEQLETACSNLLGKSYGSVLVEEFLPGREFTVGILGTAGDAYVLGTMEVVILPSAGGSIYSFEVKERYEEFVRYLRVDDDQLRGRIEELALRAYLTLQCRDAGRVDIRLNAAGEPCFMEINVLPGLHPVRSDLPIIATQEGMNYASLISAIIESAVRRTSKG